MKLSIVIVNYRGWQRLRQCLDSIRFIQNIQFDIEVIVVDNQSNDNIIGSFESDFKDFVFIENTGNNGFANGCNVGASQSSGDFILFLNPDTIINQNAIESLVETAELHPEIYILSCQQVNDQGSLTKPYGYFPGIFTLTGLQRALYKIIHGQFPIKKLRNNLSALFPHWVSGSVVLMSRANFIKIGGWNEDYWMYYEDVDLCKRVRNEGKEVALLLEVTIEHNHGGASRINIETKALTKAEALISKHTYISNHVRSVQGSIMHSYMIVENFILWTIATLLTLITLFLSDKVKLYQRVYVSILKYYMGVLTSKTWLSRRAKKYRPV